MSTKRTQKSYDSLPGKQTTPFTLTELDSSVRKEERKERNNHKKAAQEQQMKHLRKYQESQVKKQQMQ